MPTKISEYKNVPMLDLLAEIAEQIKAGKVTGVALAVKYGEKHHGIALSGDYRDDPAQVLSVTSRIAYRVNQLVDASLKSPKGGKVLDFGTR